MPAALLYLLILFSKLVLLNNLNKNAFGMSNSLIHIRPDVLSDLI